MDLIESVENFRAQNMWKNIYNKIVQVLINYVNSRHIVVQSKFIVQIKFILSFKLEQFFELCTISSLSIVYLELFCLILLIANH